MSRDIKIKKGLNINLIGDANKIISEVTSQNYAVKPPDFTGVFPKLMQKEGDYVKVGTPLFFDKYRDDILFTSPVSGTIEEIHRGAKRKLLEVRIKADGKQEAVDFGKADPLTVTREQAIEKLLQSGIWANIRQRPYSVIAKPGDKPKAIFISAFDSAPLAPDYDFLFEKEGEAFQAGIEVLKKLTGGKVHLNVHIEKNRSQVFLNAKGVEINKFSGPHPAGNPGIQIHHIDPLNKGEVVWVVAPQGVVTIGKLFLQGKYDPVKIVALTGSEVKEPKYFRVIAGTSIEDIVKDQVDAGANVRYISGNVLTGDKIARDGYLGFYHNHITVIPEGNHFEFLGWALPGFGKYSFSKTYFSWLTPGKKYRLDTNLNGGHRAFVLTGLYEKVFPMDIYPMQLLKAIIVKDIDLMEKLGIYEVDGEDFALCEFVDPSKTEMQAIVKEGLEFIRKEME